jgi:hypothetical protein
MGVRGTGGSARRGDGNGVRIGRAIAIRVIVTGMIMIPTAEPGRKPWDQRVTVSHARPAGREP